MVGLVGGTERVTGACTCVGLGKWRPGGAAGLAGAGYPWAKRNLSIEAKYKLALHFTGRVAFTSCQPWRTPCQSASLINS